MESLLQEGPDLLNIKYFTAIVHQWFFLGIVCSYSLHLTPKRKPACIKMAVEFSQPNLSITKKI